MRSPFSQRPSRICSKVDLFECTPFLRSLADRSLYADTESDAPVPIPSVEGTTLAKVIEYCEFHKESNKTKVTPESEKQWTDKYLNIEQKPLFDLILVIFVDKCFKGSQANV